MGGGGGGALTSSRLSHGALKNTCTEGSVGHTFRSRMFTKIQQLINITIQPAFIG